jgi:hypothetical protein
MYIKVFIFQRSSLFSPKAAALTTSRLKPADVERGCIKSRFRQLLPFAPVQCHFRSKAEALLCCVVTLSSTAPSLRISFHI